MSHEQAVRVIAAGVRITSAMQEVFRNADAEGRNVTLEELQIASDKGAYKHRLVEYGEKALVVVLFLLAVGVTGFIAHIALVLGEL